MKIISIEQGSVNLRSSKTKKLLLKTCKRMHICCWTYNCITIAPKVHWMENKGSEIRLNNLHRKCLQKSAKCRTRVKNCNLENKRLIQVHSKRLENHLRAS